MSMFEGKSIRHIKKTDFGYELVVEGSVISVIDKEGIAEVTEAINIATEWQNKGIDVDTNNYVRYFLMNEKGW